MAKKLFDDDYDGPWKEALRQLFRQFLQLLFPHIHDAINWARGVDFLEKELLELIPDETTREPSPRRTREGGGKVRA